MLGKVKVGMLRSPSAGSIQKPRRLDIKGVRTTVRQSLPRNSRSSACCIRDAKVHIGPSVLVSPHATEVTFRTQHTRTKDEIPAKLGHVSDSARELWILDEQPLRANP